MNLEEKDLQTLKIKTTLLYLSHIEEKKTIQNKGERKFNSYAVLKNNLFNTTQYQVKSDYKPVII
ncbi:MAG: hypothetical protein COB15_11595 [Flavobacteriales bacterium]|nr:MAG: hypothetical protein COB15_11595 [Flavobacteriales bacterium]